LSCLLRAPAFLLAFVRPSIYAACCLESAGDPRAGFDRSFKKLMEESVSSFAVSLAESLSYPISTAKMVSYLDLPPWNRRGGADDLRDARAMALSVALAHRLADEICRFGGLAALETMIEDLAEKATINPKELKALIGEVPQRFLEHASLLGLKPSRLPRYLSQYKTQIIGD